MIVLNIGTVTYIFLLYIVRSCKSPLVFFVWNLLHSVCTVKTTGRYSSSMALRYTCMNWLSALLMSQQLAMSSKNFASLCCLHWKFVCDPGSVHVTYGSYSQISLWLDYCAAGMNISRTREKKKHSIKKRQIKRRKSEHEFDSAFLDNKVMCQAFETLIM